MSVRVRAFLVPVAIAVLGFLLTWGLLSLRYAHADDVPLVDAGPDAAAVAPPVLDPASPPDPITSPGDSWTLGRTMWQRGGWQFAVVLAWVLAAVYVKRLPPPDKDGDGKPDPVGWRGRSWALTAGALAVLGPAAAVAAGVDGAAWGGVLLGLPVLVAAVADAVNPKRGAAVKAGA